MLVIWFPLRVWSSIHDPFLLMKWITWNSQWENAGGLWSSDWKWIMLYSQWKRWLTSYFFHAGKDNIYGPNKIFNWILNRIFNVFFLPTFANISADKWNSKFVCLFLTPAVLLHLLRWLNLTIMGLRERNNRINNWNEPSMSLWSLLFALFTYSNNPDLTTKLSSPNDSSDTSEAIWILWLHSVLLLINSQRGVFLPIIISHQISFLCATERNINLLDVATWALFEIISCFSIKC